MREFDNGFHDAIDDGDPYREMIKHPAAVTLRLTDIEDFEGETTVRVDPGVQMFHLSEWLDHQGFSLGLVHPGFRLPTIAGAIATGVHGSALRQSSVISNRVRWIQLVDASGTLREYSRGSTGASDPDLWKALTANLGFLGVVTKLRIAIEPTFNLKVTTRVTRTSNRLFEPGAPYSLLDGCDWGQIVWFPMAGNYAGKGWWDREPGAVVALCGNRTSAPRQTVGGRPIESRLFRPPLEDGVDGPRAGRKLLQAAACDRAPEGWWKIRGPGFCYMEYARVGKMFGHSGMPRDPDYSPFVGQRCNRDGCDDVVGAPHRMISSRIEMGSIDTPPGGFSQNDWEIAVPRQDAQAALRTVYAYLRDRGSCLPLLGVFLRFAPVEAETLIAHSVAGGAFKRGELAMFIDLPVYIPVGMTCSNQDRWEKPWIDLAAILIENHHGRAHWAKNQRSAFVLESARNTYGDNMERFRAVVARMDPHGMFANQFGVDVGLRWPESDAIASDTSGRACVADVAALGRLPKSGCGFGEDSNGAGLCYPACKPGYEVATWNICRQTCPAGYPDDGAYCRKSYDRGVGYVLWHADRCRADNPGGCEKCGAIWYPNCRAGYHSSCWQPTMCHNDVRECPPGMTNIGISCQKDHYWRGAGSPPVN